ncbi:MAG TPA: hypothetical protein PK141_13845 [Polyangiaceae bacterium]|nr:hypothetical protein [Polyangiaceae bacterium]
MKRAMAILALLSAGASALAWASACREPTQLTLELTTDVKCSDHLTTAVVVGTLAQTAQSLAERPPAIQTSACTERGAGDAYIGSLVVVPSGDDTAEVAVKVVAGIGISPDQCTDPKDKRCIVARRVRKYVANTKLVLPITLNDACRGVPCGVDETCSRGQCVSVRCEDTNTCDPPPRDAGADAGDGGEPPDADAAVRDGRAPDGAVQVPFTMALGDGFACALRSGVAYCWGKNEKGQTGQTPSQSAVTTPTRVTGVPPLPPFTTLHAAGDRVLALTGPGEVWGWGRNAGNNLGPGGDGVVAPQRLWTGVAAVSAGRFATCLLKNETVQCFGDRLTIGPTGVDGGTISELCTGATFALALSGGRVFGVRNDMAAPTPSDAGLGLTALASFGLDASHVYCGDLYAFATQANGDVLGWGENSYYTLTQDRDASGVVPVAPSPPLKGYQALAAGIDHACGIPESLPQIRDQVRCWGSGTSGAVTGVEGLNTPDPTEVAIRSQSKPVAVYAGGTQSCAQFEDGTTWCWGTIGDVARPPTEVVLPP